MSTSTHETLTVFVGEIEVPAQVVTALVKRHLLRSLRLSGNGHHAQAASPSPGPAPQPDPDHTRLAPLEDAAPAAASPAGVP